MHPVIYLNKTMVEATKARVAPVSSAMLYGRGVFTTLAIYNSQPFLWYRPWQRLAAHAKKLDIDHTGCTEKNVGEALDKLIAVNQVREGRAVADHAREADLPLAGAPGQRLEQAEAQRVLERALHELTRDAFGPVGAREVGVDDVQVDARALVRDRVRPAAPFHGARLCRARAGDASARHAERGRRTGRCRRSSDRSRSSAAR